MSTRQRAESKITQAPALALLAGAVWSLVALLRGASMVDWPWFIASGALLQWLLLLAWMGLSEHRAVFGRLALTTALLLAACLALGLLLFTYTNHRPLAAVTWVVLAACAALAGFVLVQRMRPKTELAVAVLGMFGAFAIWRSAAALHAGLLLELAVGAASFAGCWWLGRALGPRLARAWWLCAGVIIAGCVGAMALGLPERLHQIAPVVAGPVGLLY